MGLRGNSGQAAPLNPSSSNASKPSGQGEKASSPKPSSAASPTPAPPAGGEGRASPEVVPVPEELVQTVHDLLFSDLYESADGTPRPPLPTYSHLPPGLSQEDLYPPGYTGGNYVLPLEGEATPSLVIQLLDHTARIMESLYQQMDDPLESENPDGDNPIVSPPSSSLPPSQQQSGTPRTDEADSLRNRPAVGSLEWHRHRRALEASVAHRPAPSQDDTDDDDTDDDKLANN